MKKLLVILLSFINSHAFAQIAKSNDIQIDTINRSISSFIKTARDDFGSLNKHLLFLVRMYPDETDDKKLCLSLGYILQPYVYGDFKFNYYIIVKKDTLLVISEDNNFKAINKWFDLKQLTPQISTALKNKLYNGEDDISYDPPGMICCISNAYVEVKYYEYESEIPRYKSVFEVFSHGVTHSYTTKEAIEAKIALDKKNERKEKCKLIGKKKRQ